MDRKTLINLPEGSIIFDVERNRVGRLMKLVFGYDTYLMGNRWMVIYWPIMPESVAPPAFITIPEKNMKKNLKDYIRLATEVERLLYELPSGR